MTPNQARDALFETVPLTTEVVLNIKKMGQQCNDYRKDDPETYKKCPRCYGFHSVRSNLDDLCDSCIKTILQHFPHDESVPHIKAALSKW